jgi:cell wall-associated NlpC family hydrolase
MVRDIDIAQAANKLIDAPYALGDPMQGWDCVNSLLEFYEGLGVRMPTAFEGWDRANYAAKWKKDPDEGRRILGRFLRNLGVGVDFNYARRGDLMIFEGKEIPSFPGIYLGNGHILMVFDKGCRVVPFRFFQKFIRWTRRLI